MLDQIVADQSGLNRGSRDDQRYMRPAVVEELLVSNVADAVVGHEKDHGIVEISTLLEPLDDGTELVIGVAHAIEILRPVLADHRMLGQIRRKFHAVA